MTNDPPPCEFDHFVFGADSLARGVDWFEALTGVRIPPGGAHPRMGTHNHVMATGADSFLEIIAIDPAAPPPPRPRWFGLDHQTTATRLATEPQPLGWVVRTTDLEGSIAAAAAAGFDAGEPLNQTRGDLRWRIAVRPDGQMLEGGTFPLLIQWPDGAHPASAMADHGVHIETVELHHPDPVRLLDGLTAIGAAGLARLTKATSSAPGPGVRLSLGDQLVHIQPAS